MADSNLVLDAKNRALRTFLVNISVDVAVGVVMVLVTAFSRANGWGDLEWGILGFTVAKTMVVTAGSFILRRVIDPSGIPTPLPPAPVPPPNDP